MQMTTFILQHTGLDFVRVFGPGHPVVLVEGGRGPEIELWDEAVLGPRPTDAQIAAALAEPEPVVVPESVSRAQAKIQLLRAGKLDAVKTAVAADAELQIWFDDAPTWERQNPHVISLGGQLGLSAADIDEMFVAAGEIAA